MSSRIYLVGFMGVGKTTVGRDLAERLGLPFVDLDRLIEERSGSPIAELFAARGEPAFRALESQLLSELAAAPGPAVIATGGGTFARAENREIIRGSGVSVWLDAPAELMLERGARGEHRPLWGGPERALALYGERRAAYEQADLRLDLQESSAGEAAERLAELLEPYRR